jgi:ribosomal protein S18 acetylase RimI-like enzyme
MISAIAPDGERPAELISLWVAPAARGRGVGDEAVRQVLTWVRREYPASRVVLSVKVDNDHAIRLYRRHGFVDAGVSPEDRDERLMRL